MEIGIDDIRRSLDKARELTEHYNQYVLNHQRLPRSVQDLQWVMEQYLECRIEVFELDSPVPHNTVLGTYVRLPDRCHVILQPGLNFCWSRFVLCKELFHVVLDHPECRVTDIDKHLAEVVAVFPVLESRPGPTTVSEVLPEIAAMEFLFPYTQRRERLAASPSPDFLAIAEEFKIPQVLVEDYLSPSYMDNLGAFA